MELYAIESNHATQAIKMLTMNLFTTVNIVVSPTHSSMNTQEAIYLGILPH